MIHSCLSLFFSFLLFLHRLLSHQSFDKRSTRNGSLHLFGTIFRVRNIPLSPRTFLPPLLLHLRLVFRIGKATVDSVRLQTRFLIPDCVFAQKGIITFSSFFFRIPLSLFLTHSSHNHIPASKLLVVSVCVTRLLLLSLFLLFLLLLWSEKYRPAADSHTHHSQTHSPDS